MTTVVNERPTKTRAMPVTADYGLEPRMHIVAISDIHGYLPPIPECDLFLLAGDLSPVYTSHDPDQQKKWWDNALGPWLGNVRAGRKVVIAGNHDFVAHKHEEWVYEWANTWTHQGIGRITYLRDEAVEVNGWKIYGHPWVPLLRNWAFYASDLALKGKAEAIPEDTSILITHGGPHGLGDKTNYGDSAGDPSLRLAITHNLPNLKLHVFGHIHEAYGEYGIPFKDELHVCNVSWLDSDYCTTHPIMQFETVGGHIIPIVKENDLV